MTSIIPEVEQVKLLAALRGGDPAAIHPFLAEISKDRRSSGDCKHDGEIDTGAAALHLAIRCASAQTVALLLGHRAISPNGVHPPGSRTTPLHLAASLGRVDVVGLLLEQDTVDDSLRDSNGKTCRDVARSKEIVKTIDDSRSFLTASYRSLLRSYILSPPPDTPSLALINLLASPRIKHVDLSYLDDDSGLSLLHEAARRKDLRLIELAVRAGADVFVRDRKGKMAYEGVGGKDERVKVFLRQFANQDKTLLPSPVSQNEPPPVLRGYLNKYTNMAKGYGTRWFVLKDGVLSYYRHQDDETIASRGSISMKTAVLRQTDRTRFEVQSIPLRGIQSQRSYQNQGLRWYMKANHPNEAKRWIEAVGRNIDYYKREREGGGESDTGSVKRRKSMESYAESGVKIGVAASSSNDSTSTTRHKVFWRQSSNKDRDQESIIGSGRSSIVLTPAATPTIADPDPIWVPIESEKDDGGDDDDESSDTKESDLEPPHPNMELQGNVLTAQLEIINRLAESITASSQTQVSTFQTTQTHQVLTESLQTTQSLLSSFLSMSREREDWFTRQLRKERKRQRVWEESLAVVVKEGEGLEKELRKRRGRGLSFLGGATQKERQGKRRPSLLGMGTGTIKGAPAIPPEEFVTTDSLTATTPTPVPEPAISKDTPVMRSITIDTFIAPVPPTAIVITPAAVRMEENTGPKEENYDTDEEDEFFDAIESGNLPNLVVHEGLTSPKSITSPGLVTPRASTLDIVAESLALGPSDIRSLSVSQALLLNGIGIEPFAGYAALRSRLSITNDDRPSTSLWSVLKHSIGKDLTKISFPVFFNEPTSMLQRMAEDVEFSECLDVAAHEKDPLRRIAFVAAFAMSNYSSTIGRIAKPFNPMLSETFEYVRLDKQYRYISEQVSHHPPISACWCESASWNYYGEVDAQNKFMGKSFEIRPTGVAHAELLLPEDEEPDYPKARGKASKGKVVEHYSWKKVTTNVSGFILGSPTIDHYGDMVVTNHRTGDQCILTFKPRGWRGKDAYEISGQVVDSEGNIEYEIAGRWNSQLVARQVGLGNGQELHPDVSVSGTISSSASHEYILLWRNSEKPAGLPFNLTPFAITLNQCPQQFLRPFLCPTDCRLRVDQRAFELGKYELANELKQLQEEKQRSFRKAREAGDMPPHRPRWFVAETDPDTGERVWNPVRTGDNQLDYWVEREKVWKAGGVEKAQWKDVDEIFVDEPHEVKLMLKNLETQDFRG